MKLPSRLVFPSPNRRMFGRGGAASHLEHDLAQQIHLSGLPRPEREYRFDLVRKWRSDFAWPVERLLVEVEGGIHTNGRHVRSQGFEGDAEKYNTATALGWRLLRVTGRQIRTGQALKWIEECLEIHE